MKLHHKLCALVCAILFVCTSIGCATQPNLAVPEPTSAPAVVTPASSVTPAEPVITADSLVQAAKQELAKGEKAAALSLIAQAMRREGYFPKQEELRELWWNSMADVSDVPKEMLTEDELRALSAVAYLVSFTDCFFDARELGKEQLLIPLYIYYGIPMSLPLYSRPGWDTVSFQDAYPPDGEDGSACYMSAGKANEFIKQLLGIDIPDLEADGQLGSEIVCKDGVYTVAWNDIQMGDFLVSGYRYVGDGLFYIDFDWDTSSTPDPDEDHGIRRDVRRLVVRRSSSAWGFTVVSKLEDGDGDITLPDVSRPEGMTYFINRPAFYDEQQHINARAIAWLEQRIAEGAEHEELNTAEIEKINELAHQVAYVIPYFEAKELEKRDFIWTLSFYYQQAFRYNYQTEQYEIEKGLTHPPDGILDTEELALRMFLPLKTAEAVTNDILGAGIPDSSSDYGDPEDEYVVCNDGVYYIWATDTECPVFYLNAYQYLGDDMFYLSFDTDDRWMAGAAWSQKGIVADDCRLVVKRSDSEWGFTVVSKLKDGAETILPDNFPPPKYSIPYEPRKLT